MKEKEEGKPSSVRRVADDDYIGRDDNPSPAVAQPLDTLRNGYSWVRSLEARYPGWHLHPVEGFHFTLPVKDLFASRVCMISLAGVYRKGQKPFNISPGVVPPPLRVMRFRDRGDWSFREIPVSADAAELAIAHAHYDHTEADEDINCVFPLARLVELEVEGFIGEAAPTHYSFMGYVPEVKPILDATARDIIPRLRKQGVDVVVVSGGCEISHQSAALIQREIEAAGIPTVGVSVCPDITYQLQAPRAATLRFPLGNPFGSSMDASMQSRVLRDSLTMVDDVQTPGEIKCLPYDWIKLEPA
ncbi:MAG TPA: glycine/sarcosine/betaine reductase selenoprotein B family protein [Acidobacteriota bacterium]|nr:glycine/sarcosine/betaine reductase selenoprotein B family protein [Acidobacteriota bacterium]